MGLISTNPLFQMPAYTSPYQNFLLPFQPVQPPFSPFAAQSQAQPGNSPPAVTGGSAPAGFGDLGGGAMSGPSGAPSGSQGIGPAGTTSPAGVSGQLGISGMLGVDPAALSVAGMVGGGLLGVPAPMGTIDNTIGALQANNSLSKEGAQTLGVTDVAKAVAHDIGSLFGVDIGKSLSQAAEESNNNTAAAQGIGVSTGSVDVGNSLAGGNSNDSGTDAGSGTGGGSNGPGNGPGPGGGQGGEGDGGEGSYAKGGIIKRVGGKNPRGPDQGSIHAQRGEAVLNRHATALLGPRGVGLLNALGTAHAARRGLLR